MVKAGPVQPSDIQRLRDIRRANLAAVLRYIDAEPGVSQSDIGDALGLASGGVNSLVTELEALGALAGATSAGSSRGRPKRSLRLSAPGLTVVGIEVSTHELQVRVVALDGTEIEHRAEPLGSAPGSPADLGVRILALVQRLGGAPSARRRPIAIAVAIPGVVANGSFASPAFWEGFHATTAVLDQLQGMAEATDLINDGDAAAFSELQLGALRGVETAIALHGSDGVAGGLVSSHELLTGYLGLAGEVGHIVIEPNGPLCECGQRGCLGQVASIRAIARYLGEEGAPAADTHRAYAQRLAIRAAAGEDDVLRALSIVREHIHSACRTLSAVISPECFVLTGNFVPIAQWILAASPSPDGEIIWDRPIVTSQFGTDSVLIGAGETARQRVLNDPASFLTAS